MKVSYFAWWLALWGLIYELFGLLFCNVRMCIWFSENINENLERHLAEGDLQRFSSISEKQGRLSRSSVSSSSQSIAAVISNASKEVPINYFALVAVLVALLAIAVYLLLHSLGEWSAFRLSRVLFCFMFRMISGGQGFRAVFRICIPVCRNRENEFLTLSGNFRS